MDKLKAKKEALERRRTRVRGKIFGTAQRPRLSVYRSNACIYAQLIDDVFGKTLVSASSADRGLEGELSGLNKTDAAAKVGEALAKKAGASGIKSVVFDRGGRLYHGRIKALAEGARRGGLEF